MEKQEIRNKVDSMLLSVKLMKVTLEHKEPVTGDQLIEVLLEEIGKLHSDYGKERTIGADACAGRGVEGAAPYTESREDGSEERTSDARSYEGETDCHGLRPRNDTDVCGGEEDSEWHCCDDCDNERTCGLDFGAALRMAKKGARIARLGWSGKGQFVILATNIEFHTDADLSALQGRGVEGHDALAFFGASGVQVGWLASQADMLSDDWYVVE